MLGKMPKIIFRVESIPQKMFASWRRAYLNNKWSWRWMDRDVDTGLDL